MILDGSTKSRDFVSLKSGEMGFSKHLSKITRTGTIYLLLLLLTFSFGMRSAYAATGGFNGDGCDDLVVGVPYENNDGSTADSGRVNVIYGDNLYGTCFKDQDVDLVQVRVHDLKHTFGRRLRAASVPLETPKGVVGSQER